MRRESLNGQLMDNLSMLINMKNIKNKNHNNNNNQNNNNNKNNQTNLSMAGKSPILINHFNK